MVRLVTGPDSKAVRAKKKKRRFTGGRKNVGKLKNLLGIPLDVLHNVRFYS